MDQKIYYRLIALWALCEGVLGGIIHGFKLPVTGLIVGSSAVMIICLIGYYVPDRSAILKATITVCIFKLMLSPQSPVTAYVAVLFQGLTGSLFFANHKFYKTSCLLFATLALFESGVQRILVMTILFGVNFWKAVNDFINGLTHQKEITNYSLYFVGAYVLLHILVGIFVGWYAGRIPKQIEALRTNENYRISLSGETELPATSSNKRRKFKISLLIIWLILLLLFLQSQFHIGTPLLSSNLSVQIFVRSIIIIFAWYFVVSPLLMMLLRKWLAPRKEKSQNDVKAVLELLPSTNLLFRRSWKLSSDTKGVNRISRFWKIVLVNSFYNSND